MTKEYILSIHKVIENECWIRISSNGIKYHDYNKVMINGIEYRLHVLTAYIFIGGFILDYGAPFICHKCNNPGCFNPEHLYLGTDSSNMIDAVRAKTHVQARKEVCPKCGGAYTTKKIKSGWSRGTIRRVCKVCKTG